MTSSWRTECPRLRPGFIASSSVVAISTIVNVFLQSFSEKVCVVCDGNRFYDSTAVVCPCVICVIMSSDPRSILEAILYVVNTLECSFSWIILRLDDSSRPSASVADDVKYRRCWTRSLILTSCSWGLWRSFTHMTESSNSYQSRVVWSSHNSDTCAESNRAVMWHSDLWTSPYSDTWRKSLALCTR